MSKYCPCECVVYINVVTGTLPIIFIGSFLLDSQKLYPQLIIRYVSAVAEQRLLWKTFVGKFQDPDTIVVGFRISSPWLKKTLHFDASE